jgi:hypothetical protein
MLTIAAADDLDRDAVLHHESRLMNVTRLAPVAPAACVNAKYRKRDNE